MHDDDFATFIFHAWFRFDGTRIDREQRARQANVDSSQFFVDVFALRRVPTRNLDAGLSGSSFDSLN
jgi:hypothetical protein